MPNLTCPECGKKFKTKQTLARHQQKFHKPKPKVDKALSPPSHLMPKAAVKPDEFSDWKSKITKEMKNWQSKIALEMGNWKDGVIKKMKEWEKKSKGG